MNWDDLRIFLALSRAGTLSAAGMLLEVKHSTISRRISAFEETLGTRLFERLREGYVLTQAGENLLEHAHIMEEQAQAVDRKVFGLDTQLKGTLNVTSPNDVLSRLVVPQLGLFKRIYPAIDLQLISTAGLVDMAARQADIALRITDKPADYLLGKKVVSLRHGIYASSDYLSKHQNKHHVILWRSETQAPEWVSDHFPTAHINMRVDDASTMLACAQNHMGLARLACFMGDNVPGLMRLDLPLTPSTWGIWVLSHVDLRSTARVRAGREFLVDIIEQQRGLIEGLNSNYWKN
jgi:DNA-binding transcriptional LysR family regulator